MAAIRQDWRFELGHRIGFAPPLESKKALKRWVRVEDAGGEMGGRGGREERGVQNEYSCHDCGRS